jgi:hypothetical protein
MLICEVDDMTASVNFADIAYLELATLCWRTQQKRKGLLYWVTMENNGETHTIACQRDTAVVF